MMTKHGRFPNSIATNLWKNIQNCLVKFLTLDPTWAFLKDMFLDGFLGKQLLVLWWVSFPALGPGLILHDSSS